MLGVFLNPDRNPLCGVVLTRPFPHKGFSAFPGWVLNEFLYYH
jgi:hypothetical protein